MEKIAKFKQKVTHKNDFKARRKTFFMFCMVLVTSFLCVNLVSAGVFDSGVIGYWNFDEGSGTVANNQENVSYNGFEGDTNSWRTGKLSNAYNLTDDYTKTLNISNYSDMGSFVNPENPFSISFWALPYTATGSVFGIGTNPNKHFYIGIRGAGAGSWAVTWNSAAGMKSTDAPVLNNEWQHVVMTYGGGSNVTNVTFYINGTAQAANIEADTNPSVGWTNPVGGGWIGNAYDFANDYTFDGGVDELGFWNRELTASEVSELYNSGDGLSFIYPNITLNTPIDGFGSYSQSINFNCSSQSDSGILNLSLLVDGVIEHTITNSTPDQNLSLEKLVIVDVEDHNWTCRSSDLYSTKTADVRTLSISTLQENAQNFNSSTYETNYERFNISVSYNSSIYTSSSANLIYNGTSYSSTKSGSGNNIIFTRLMDIPLLDSIQENRTFYWNVSLTNSSGTFGFSSTEQTQTVNPIIFTLCNSSYTTKFLNLTFKDETTDGFINASIPSSTFTYYIGTGSINKSYSFVNNTDNFEYDFCASPNGTMNVFPYIQYKQGSDYPQRLWNPGVTSYSNVTTNQTLYLLEAADGLYVTFQVVNPSNQVLSGVEVVGTRSIGGSDVIVAQGTTDGAGTVTFWLNPDFEHTLTFSKSGFDTLIETIYPTQSSYTVTMGESVEVQVSDYTYGITLSILPSVDDTLFNDTTYNFNMTISSSYWDLDNFGFDLRLNNGSVLDSVTSTADGGTVSIDLDVSNHSNIIMYYNWTVNGTTQTRIARWNVFNTDYTGWSIKTFFTDLKNYMDTDMFGLDDFGRHLIIYLVLFISIGVMSYKYGLTSPISVVTMIFGIIYFFDVVTGMLPNPIGAIPNFFTWMAGSILAVIIIKGVMRR